jgi:hypothetical protein
MEQDLDTSKSAARPSQGAVEDEISTNKLTGQTEREKLDQIGMKSAKRAENRFKNDEGEIPGSSIFTK